MVSALSGFSIIDDRVGGSKDSTVAGQMTYGHLAEQIWVKRVSDRIPQLFSRIDSGQYQMDVKDYLLLLE